MGRVKLQMKRIENTANRQVTFSKRRNGLIKKAYELSVLCDVDIALIMFSPSGRLSLFSGHNKSIEEVLRRYVDLPEQDSGRTLPNQESLRKMLCKLKGESNLTYYHMASLASSDSPVEAVDATELIMIHHELLRCKSQLDDKEKQLRVYEGDPREITTLPELQCREEILQETLRQVQRRVQLLEKSYISTSPDSKRNLGWLLQRDPQVQILNFLGSNVLLPSRS
ncbi:agamous-like MADS-box protein AGL104 isoform X2 [Punica granatum]|uniref:Agamous-like MADS-box protein AGL104 isoform X2 n=1 Tax=Punica granatum TaxID=22663 RepID=A0A6P8EE32_PUNGR|nr:agamous-like MADS-box protein AGL104 isoform X2 [Punica granatum]